MGARALIVVLAGTAAGLWAWGDLDSVNFWGQGTLSSIGNDTAFQLAMVALLFLAGFAVRRWWIVLATAGPLLALGLAQAAGERGFDGGAPLTSPSGISRLFWTALVLLLGCWLGSWAGERRARSGLG